MPGFCGSLKKGVHDAEEQTSLSAGIPGRSGAPGAELGPADGAGGSAWGKQAELDAGLRSDGLVTAEREELRRLRLLRSGDQSKLWSRRGPTTG